MAADFKVGDTVTLVFTPGGDVSSFSAWLNAPAGATVSIYGNGKAYRGLGPVTIAGDGSSASYTTHPAADFLYPGPWIAELVLSDGGSPAKLNTSLQVNYLVEGRL